MNDDKVLRVHDLRLGRQRRKDAAGLWLHVHKFELRQGEILAIIGPNGAGKTTLLNVLTGLISNFSGRVMIAAAPDGDGSALVDIRRLKRLGQPLPVALFHAGVRRMFQGPRVFERLTVREHLNIAMPRINATVPWAGATLRKGELPHHVHAVASEVLEYWGLLRHADQPASALSLGERKLLWLSMLQASVDPRMLSSHRPKHFIWLLDEPTTELAGFWRQRVVDFVKRRVEGGDAAIVVEHDVDLVLSWAHRVCILRAGKITRSGPPGKVISLESLRAAFGR